MHVTIEPGLFTDPQAAVPAAYCERCGGELWLPSLRCNRCEKEGLYDLD